MPPSAGPAGYRSGCASAGSGNEKRLAVNEINTDIRSVQQELGAEERGKKSGRLPGDGEREGGRGERDDLKARQNEIFRENAPVRF